MTTVYQLRANCPACGVLLRTDRLRAHVLARHPDFSQSKLIAIEELMDQVISANPGRRIAFDLRTLSAKFLDLRSTIRLELPPPLESIATVEAVRELTPELIRHLRNHSEDIQSVPWQVFEHLVAELLASMGFEEVALVGSNSTTAADVFAAWRVGPLQSKIRYFVEVKRWKDRVGVEVIDRVYGAMLAERPVHGWHAAMIVSVVGYRDFERYSPARLKNLGIELKSRDDLVRWLEDYEPKPNGQWLPKDDAAPTLSSLRQ